MAAAYIAGVGSSPLPSRTSPAKQVVKALVSAATKALLDAGITFDDVTQGVTNLRSREFGDASLPFKAFDSSVITVDEVEDGHELECAVDSVQNRGAQSALVIATRNVRMSSVILMNTLRLGSDPERLTSWSSQLPSP